ncbi:MAG: cardiolipin synthase [Firmicutes bacterium]|nr:cardiolipin synthase [Bacillota bacterium]
MDTKKSENRSDARIYDRETLLRLAKPMKRGLLRLVFSRFFLIVLFIVFEVLLVLSFYDWLQEYLNYLSAFQALFTVVMVVYLFNSSMDSSARLTWMFIIALAPLPGAALLWFTQTSVGHRLIKMRFAQLTEETRGMLEQDEKILYEVGARDPSAADLKHFLDLSGDFPIYGDTRTDYLPSGEDAFSAMLRELAKAKKTIFMEFFIIEEGYMWSEILKILVRKAEEGVDVRVMYDGMCDMFNLPMDYCRRLQAKGIKAKKFAPIRPVVSSHYNYRDHRKIMVIDGKTAFTGGVNLADEYINKKERFGHWKDAALMVKGGAAKSFELMFLNMWNIDEKTADLSPLKDIHRDAEKIREKGYVMPYSDCPLDEFKAGENVYMDIINRAHDHVWIMTPYLILDDELRTSIRFAAQRGIDIRIILPGIPDKKMAYALAKSHYKDLISSGVKIYEYTPGFIHSKVFSCDGERAVVGTINLDYRSLYHHFECAAYLYGCPCIADIDEDFNRTFRLCSRVTPQTIKNEKLFYRAAGSLLKFLAPLM